MARKNYASLWGAVMIAMIIMVNLANVLPVLARAPEKVIKEGNGIALHEFGSGWMQIVNLAYGARLTAGTAKVWNDKGGGNFGGLNPSISIKTVNKFSPDSFCTVNASFYNGNLTISHPLKIDGEVISEGYQAENQNLYEMLLLRIWPDHADIVKSSREAFYTSDAPTIIGGLSAEGAKEKNARRARTFAGIFDSDGDGVTETVLIYTANAATQAQAANTLREWGAQAVIMFDGGNSTGLVCGGEWLKYTDREVPVVISTYPGTKPPPPKEEKPPEPQPVEPTPPPPENPPADYPQTFLNIYTGDTSIGYEDYSTREYNGGQAVAGETVIGYLHWIDDGTHIPGIDISNGSGATAYNPCPEGGYVTSGADGWNVGENASTYIRVDCQGYGPTAGWMALLFHAKKVTAAGNVQPGEVIGKQSNHFHLSLCYEGKKRDLPVDQYYASYKWCVDPTLFLSPGNGTAPPAKAPEVEPTPQIEPTTQVTFPTVVPNIIPTSTPEGEVIVPTPTVGEEFVLPTAELTQVPPDEQIVPLPTQSPPPLPTATPNTEVVEGDEVTDGDDVVFPSPGMNNFQEYYLVNLYQTEEYYLVQDAEKLPADPLGLKEADPKKPVNFAFLGGGTILSMMFLAFGMVTQSKRQFVTGALGIFVVIIVSGYMWVSPALAFNSDRRLEYALEYSPRQLVYEMPQNSALAYDLPSSQSTANPGEVIFPTSAYQPPAQATAPISGPLPTQTIVYQPVATATEGNEVPEVQPTSTATLEQVSTATLGLPEAIPQTATETPVPAPKPEGNGKKQECLESISGFPAEITQWGDLICRYAPKAGLDPTLVAAQMLVESNGNPDAYSKSGAVGLLQAMPKDGIAASFMCENGPCFSDRPTMKKLFDPEFNVQWCTEFLRSKIDYWGSLRDGLKAYGPMDVGYSYADKVLNYQDRFSR